MGFVYNDRKLYFGYKRNTIALNIHYKAIKDTKSYIMDTESKNTLRPSLVGLKVE